MNRSTLLARLSTLPFVGSFLLSKPAGAARHTRVPLFGTYDLPRQTPPFEFASFDDVDADSQGVADYFIGLVSDEQRPRYETKTADEVRSVIAQAWRSGYETAVADKTGELYRGNCGAFGENDRRGNDA